MHYRFAIAAALALQVSTAHAESMVALIGGDILATVDIRTGKTTGLTKIDGMTAVLGVDVRPADGQLYALASDGTVATIDPATGKTTPKSKLDVLPPPDAQISVDFNPVADKMRIIGSDGTNLRADVDSGKVTKDQSLKFAETDSAAGQQPSIIAGAYSNSVKGAKETTLYDIDAGLAALFRQVPPNDGVLNTVGPLGLDAETVGFDIVSDGAGANTAVLVAKGSLYTLDLNSGRAEGGKAVAGLPSDVRDIAVLPEPARRQAASLAAPAGVDPTADVDVTSAYLPKTGAATPNSKPSKPAPRTKAGSQTKLEAAPKPQYRAEYVVQQGAYAASKITRGKPACGDGKALY